MALIAGDECIRLLIADDHAVLRAGLRLLLDAQPDMLVVGEAEQAIALNRRVESANWSAEANLFMTQKP